MSIHEWQSLGDSGRGYQHRGSRILLAAERADLLDRGAGPLRRWMSAIWVRAQQGSTALARRAVSAVVQY
jgi:hypothetical protein